MKKLYKPGCADLQSSLTLRFPEEQIPLGMTYLHESFNKAIQEKL